MKNEEKNRKQQLTSLPISINIAILLWWAVRQILRLFFITLKLLFWGLIALFILYAII